jgi:threonine dehydratase
MRGAFVHPFEDDAFIAGNASAGLEILVGNPFAGTTLLTASKAPA